MKAFFQYKGGWPVLIAAVTLGFGGAILSGKTENQWWFIVGFLTDLALVLGYVFTNEETAETNEAQQAESEPPAG